MSPKFDPALHEAIKAQPWQHASFLSGTAGRSQPQKQGGDADDQQQPLPPEDDGGGVGPVPGAPSPRDEAASDPTSDEENGGAGGASEYSPSTPEHDLDLDQLLPDDTLLQAFVPAAGCADSSVRAENASASVADARPSATVREAPPAASDLERPSKVPRASDGSHKVPRLNAVNFVAGAHNDESISPDLHDHDLDLLEDYD